MQIVSRAAVVAAFGVGPLLLLAGCGGTTDAGTEATLAKIQPTSFVELPPLTTTTTTPPPIDGGSGAIAPGEQAYTVRPNDSISKIAALHDITMDNLVAYNSWSDGLSHGLSPGDVVKIPPGASVAGTETVTETDTGSDTNTDTASDTNSDAASDTNSETASDTGGEECPTTYTIKSGDNTRIGVAEQFGITYEQMDAANASTPGYASFVVGTQITIPCP